MANFKHSNSKQAAMYANKGSLMYAGLFEGNVKITQQLAIGTNSKSGYMLSVKGNTGIDGKLDAEEVEIMPISWADFVFDSNYKLKPLHDIEQYIKLHKHLPDVPSEAEVLENGINVAEMDAILLQKIEELTLYMIDLNKQVEELKKENAKLRKKH